MSSGVTGVWLVLGVEEGHQGVKLVQRQTVMQAPLT